MKQIIWEEYLEREDLKTCTEADLEKEEQEVGVILPKALKFLIMNHGGQSPENLIPIYPNGKRMIIECIYHAYADDDEDDGYTISFSTSCLKDDGYNHYIAFSHRGNVFLALDYNVREIDPPVVFIFRDSPPNDPEHRYLLADTFQEFLEKYTV
jgi:hypothetical protein